MSRRWLPDICLRAQTSARKRNAQGKYQRPQHEAEDCKLGVRCQASWRAPGQQHAEELVKRLMALMPEYDRDYSTRKRGE